MQEHTVSNLSNPYSPCTHKGYNYEPLRVCFFCGQLWMCYLVVYFFLLTHDLYHPYFIGQTNLIYGMDK